MHTTLLNILDAEARAGLPALRGTRLSGTIPLTEAVINDVAASFPIVPEVQILDGNQIVATVWGMPVRATIVDIDQSLTLRIGLPWLARRVASTSSWVRLDGDHAVVDLAAFPQVSQYRQFLKHVTSLRIQTVRGTLLLHFQLTVA